MDYSMYGIKAYKNENNSIVEKLKEEIKKDELKKEKEDNIKEMKERMVILEKINKSLFGNVKKETIKKKPSPKPIKPIMRGGKVRLL